jgi:hypothetical protein
MTPMTWPWRVMCAEETRLHGGRAVPLPRHASKQLRSSRTDNARLLNSHAAQLLTLRELAITIFSASACIKLKRQAKPCVSFLVSACR